ncbi:MAG: 3-phosphoshikimate 1-carboxyvinyltransferase [Pyrinomonadaceae bacterium]
MRIKPAQRVLGRLKIPGDKSISHRAAIIAGVSAGASRLRNFSTSQDCAATLSCLRQLGVVIEHDGSDVRLESAGVLSAPSATLDCGNSGSAMRMLAGVLAGQPFSATLMGDESLQSRPMRRIIEPLELMGAVVLSEKDRPPLRITGSASLRPISYRLPVASAQVKSCILLAGLNAGGRTEILEKTPTRDHTERMLQWFGALLEITRSADPSATRIAIDGPVHLGARDVSVPGDISSAAFFIAAAALLPESNLMIEDVGLNPTRTQFLRVLSSMGAEIETENIRDECNEPVGTVKVRAVSSGFMAKIKERCVISGAMIPALIDELPLLAVVGTQIEGGIEIREAAELRVKETDRIAATVANLRAMGADVEEHEDGLAVKGPARLRGAMLDSYGDHRIAMAFAVAALMAEGESEIREPECVAVSFPDFFERLESIVQR